MSRGNQGQTQLPRRTRDETRALLLDAGSRLLTRLYERTDDRLIAEALAHVKFHDSEIRANQESGLRDVLMEATAIQAEEHDIANPRPITTGAAYSAFDSENDFRAKLTSEVLKVEESVNSRPQAQAFVELAAEYYPDQAPIEAVISRLADAQWHHDRVRPEIFVQFLFFPFANHPEIRAALQANYQDTAASLVKHYTPLLDAYGLRMRPPLEIEHLATALQALLEGFDLRYRVDSDAVSDRLVIDDTDWSIFAYSARAIILDFVEEDPDKAPAAGPEIQRRAQETLKAVKAGETA